MANPKLLIWAIKEGHANVLQAILRHRPEFSKTETVLYKASCSNENTAKLVQLLLDSGADMSTIFNKNIHLIKESAANLFIQRDPNLLSFFLEHSHHPVFNQLYRAAKESSALLDKQMLLTSSYHEKSLRELKFALYSALNDNHRDAFIRLFECFTKRTVDDFFIADLLESAIKNQSKTVLDFLLIKFPSLRTVQLFQKAMKNNTPDILQFLLIYIPINSYDEYGRTALHYAVAEARFSMATFLILNGAAVLLHDFRGNTPLDILREIFVVENRAHQKVWDLHNKMMRSLNERSEPYTPARQLDITSKMKTLCLESTDFKQEQHLKKEL